MSTKNTPKNQPLSATDPHVGVSEQRRTTWAVKTVAGMTGLTVRTLHHYDDTGLVRPSRDPNGYRAYDAEDLARLHEVRIYREMSFDLDEIRKMIATDARDRTAVLTAQHAALEQRAERLMGLIDVVERAIRAERTGIRLSPQAMFEVFGDTDPTAYIDEVEERWSGERLDESRRRTRGYGAEQWLAIKTEAKEQRVAMAELLRAGVSPQSTEAQHVAEAMRQHIDHWFYPCSRAQHRALAQMYTEDLRFEATYEKLEAGLAAYVRAAIEANRGEG